MCVAGGRQSLKAVMEEELGRGTEWFGVAGRSVGRGRWRREAGKTHWDYTLGGLGLRTVPP